MIGPTTDSFQCLFDTHAAAVLRFAQRRVGDDKTAAWDVVSETFLVAWRHWDEGPAQPGDHLPWLYGIARNAIRNLSRSGSRRSELLKRLTTTERAGIVEDLADSVVDLDRLNRVLRKLPEADREVLRLVGWEDLGPAGVGQVLGISSTAAGVRIHRARRRLRQMLTLADGEEPVAPTPPIGARTSLVRSVARSESQEA